MTRYRTTITYEVEGNRDAILRFAEEQTYGLANSLFTMPPADGFPEFDQQIQDTLEIKITKVRRSAS